MSSVSKAERPLAKATLALAVLAALGSLNPAVAQEQAESWFPVLPGQEGAGGTLTLINGSGRSSASVALPHGDIADLTVAIGDAGDLNLAPGQAVRIAYSIGEVPGGDIAIPSALQIHHTGGLHAFARIRQGGHIAATYARSRSRATTNFVIPWQEPAGEDPVTLRVGMTNPGMTEVDAVLIVRDPAGAIEAEEMVFLPPLLPVAFEFDLGDAARTAGARRVELSASGAVLVDAILETPAGLTFLPAARDLPENAQFWFPYVNDLGLETLFANLPAGNAYAGEVRFFDPKGVPINGFGTFNAGAGGLETVPAFNGGSAPIVGAISVDITSGSAPRAPSISLHAAGDMTLVDPLRRIGPGSHGVAPIPTDDPALLANSVLVVNNPAATTGLGKLLLRDAQGRVLRVKRLKVKPFATVALPLRSLVGKRATTVYLEIVNPPLVGAKPRGGGDFHAAVVLSSAVVAHKKKAGTGESGRLAVYPIVASDIPDVPMIIAPQVAKADNDRKGFLALDGLAAGIGKVGRLRLLGGNPVQEWRVRGGKQIKLKLKAKSLLAKQTLASQWPLGEERTFVLVDDATNAASEERSIRRGEALDL